MSDRRPELEELGEIAALPGDDPRRRAIEADPRAAAQLRAYQEFVNPGQLPEGADVAAAEARLLEALERELGVTLNPASPRPAPASTDEGGLGRLFSWLGAPAWRSALAMAGALAVIVGTWTWLAPREGREQPNLRGPSIQASPGTWEARLAAAGAGVGQVRLSWNEAPGATRYAVVFLAADLRELARVDDVSGTELGLTGADLPSGLLSGQAVLWRVTAYQGADEIGRSPTAPLTVP